MSRQRVKIIETKTVADLEDYINKFLNDPTCLKVIDVKVSVGGSKPTSVKKYMATIIYDTKKYMPSSY